MGEGNQAHTRLACKNKDMKNVLKVTFGGALALMVLFANGQRPERPSPEKMLEKFTEELSLTEEQVGSWREIHETYEEDMKSDPRATMPKVEAEIEKILTAEQWEQFQQMRLKKKKRRDG